ncbi:MAG: c-type cytochrome domain-containing protein [Planctomycetota bacterium]
MIRPLMRKHCQTCHNPQRTESGLDLSTYEGIQNGSDLGSVVTPGDAKDSLLYLVVAHLEEPAMPPGGEPLSVSIQQQIADWIDLKLPRSASDPVAAAARAEVSMVEDAIGVVDNGLVFEPKQMNPITAVAASPDGLVAWPGQRQIVLQDINDGSVFSVLAYPEGECFDLEFTDQGRKLVAAGGVQGESGHVTVWDVASRARIAMYGNEFDVLLAAAFSPDGTRLVSGGPQGVLRVADTTTGKTVWQSDKHTDWILDVAVDPEGLMLASADRSGNVFVWELESGDRMHVLNGNGGAVAQVAWADGGSRLITVCADSEVRSWDMHWGNLLERSKVDPDGLLGVTVDAADQLTTVGRSTGVRTWDAVGGTITHQGLDGHICCEVSASPGFLVVGTFDGGVFFRKVASGNTWEKLTLAPETVTDDFERIAAVPRRSSQFVDLRSVAEQFLSVDPVASDAIMATHQTRLAEPEVTDFAWLAARLAIERDRHAALRKELKALEDESRSMAQGSPDSDDGPLRDLISQLQTFQETSDETKHEGLSLEVDLLVKLTLEKAKALASSRTPVSSDSATLQLRLDAVDQEVARWEQESLFPRTVASQPWLELRKRLDGLRNQLTTDALPTMIVD